MKNEIVGFILRLSIALGLAIYTIINENKKTHKMSRIIDDTLSPISAVKSDIIDYCASLGVVEADENPTVVPCGESPQTWSAEDFAVYYGRLFELTSSDFSGINFATHPAWGGPTRPPRPYA